MSGSSKSFNTITLFGCRVAGAPYYTPAHIPVGAQKPIRQMAVLTVFQNINGKPSKFRVTGWGKMADVMARSCAPGKEVHLECELHSYQGKVALPSVQGQPVQFAADPSGAPLMIEKVGMSLRNIVFGSDSDKQVQFEIQNGMRPPLWNVAGHPDNTAWKQVCQQRNATNFAPGNGNFGYAVVRTPNGQIVDPATINNANLNTQGGGYNTGTAQYGGQPAGNAGNAGNAPAGFQGTTQWNQNGNAGQPVNVNGQTVGYTPNGGGYAQGGYTQAPAGGGQPAPAGTGFAM